MDQTDFPDSRNGRRTEWEVERRGEATSHTQCGGRRAAWIRRFPVRQFRAPPGLAADPLPDSPRVSHRRARLVRGRCPEPVSNHGVGSGGQGRNRTIDTRIFSSSESAVRREKVEDREGVFDGPTEPPAPTEPIPNPGRQFRPNCAVSSRRPRAAAHRDRTGTEPAPPDLCVRKTK